MRSPLLLFAALGLAAATTAISGARHGLRPLVLRGRRATSSSSREEGPPEMRVRLRGPAGASSDEMHRTGWLTPYTVQTIAEDALRAGRGARLEVTVAAATSPAELRRVRHRLAHLANRGIQVHVSRDDEPVALGRHPPSGSWAGDRDYS
jgi:hypothetical protein